MEDKNAIFIELAKEFEKKKEETKLIGEKLETIMKELGVGTYVQDPDTMSVYKIVKPTGTFTYYKDINYVRTALPGEKRGDLAKAEAEEAGFILKK